MLTDMAGQQIPTLMQYLVSQFRQQQLGARGEPGGMSAEESLVQDSDVTSVPTIVDAFVAFCEKHLADHPPQQHIMLAQGFGVELAGGIQVSLTPDVYGMQGSGDMQSSDDVDITAGAGRSDTLQGREVDVTGGR